MDIVSKTNPKIKEYIKLRDKKKYRSETALFTIEGIKNIYEAAKFGKIKSIFYKEEMIEHLSLKFAVEKACESFVVGDEVCEKLADTKENQGVFAICKMPIFDFTPNEDSRIILLENLQDPGNMGTILRTATAFGIDAVYCCSCVDNYSPKVARSTAGAIFKLPTVNISAKLAVVELKAKGIKIFGAAVDESSEIFHSEMISGGVCICIGNEGQGLSDEIKNLCDKKVIIPIDSSSESLNAAVAASIFIWEMRR